MYIDSFMVLRFYDKPLPYTYIIDPMSDGKVNDEQQQREYFREIFTSNPSCI